MPTGFSLYADLGNTSMHLGLYDGQWLAEGRAYADELAEDDLWADTLRETIELAGRQCGDCVSAAVCASGDLAVDLLAALEEVTGKVPHVVGPEDHLGIEVFYDPPQSLGRDRLLAALAAKSKPGSPVIVLDVGTFITCDALDQTGRLIPVGIAPGLPAIVAGSCSAGPGLAARVIEAAESEEFEVAVPASSTLGSLRNGLAACLGGTVDRLVRMARERVPSEAPVIVTGGDADLVMGAATCDMREYPLLVLDGLRLADPARKP